MRSSEYGLPGVLLVRIRPVRLPSFQHSESPLSGQQYFRLARRLIACACLCQALAACAVATPLGEQIDPQPTGSISAPPVQDAASSRLPASLDEEDRRRALGALAIALDPQGNGASVRWDNPVSKAHGEITPIGFAYPSNDLICRKFSARFDTVGGSRMEQGSACRDKNANWTIAELQPAKAEASPLREARLAPK
jgi:surface antigen